MPWWGIVLLVLFCDWTALGFMGMHLSKKAERAVMQGAADVQKQLQAELAPFTQPVRMLLERFGVGVNNSEKEHSDKV